jgi:hypothetical protein
MECVICGKLYEKDVTSNFCNDCGIGLVDDEREAYLRKRLQETETAQGELEKNQEQGHIDEATYSTISRTLAQDLEDIWGEIVSIVGERGSLRDHWVNSSLAQAGRLYEYGRLPEAFETADRVLQFDHSIPSAHVLMARILSFMGNPEEALRAVKYAASLDPSNVEIEKYQAELEAWYDVLQRHQADNDTRSQASAPQPPPSAPRPASEKYQSKPFEGGKTPAPRPAGEKNSSKPFESSQTTAPRPVRQRPDLAKWVRNLVERGFLKWWYFVGTFLLLAGVIGLVTWQWNRVGKYAVFALVLLVTAGLYLLGHFLDKRAHLGSTIILVIASILVPLDIYLFDYYAIGGRSYDVDLLGIAGSIIAAAIYGVNYYRTRNQALLAFAALTPLSLLFFILRGSGIDPHYYGPWFVGLGAAYFIAAYMMKRAGKTSTAKTLYAVANVAIVTALLTTLGDYRYFLGEGFRSTGFLVAAAAVVLFMGSHLYEDKVLAYISSGLLVISSYFLIQEGGSPWYQASPGLAIAAGVLLITGFLDSMLGDKDQGAPAMVVGTVTLVAIFAVLAGKDLLFNLPTAWKTASSSEMLSSFVAASIVAVLLWAEALLEKKKWLGYVASSALVYTSLIFLGRWVSDIPIWCMVEATAVAGLLFVMGLVLEKTMDAEWALTAYIPALMVCGVSTAAAAVFYLPVVSRDILPGLPLYEHAYLSLTVTAVATTIYLSIATIRTKKAPWLYAACTTAIIAYAAQAHAAAGWGWIRDLSGGGINYGLLFLPLALTFGVAGHAWARAGHRELSAPLFTAFFTVSAFVFASQFYYIFLGPSAAAVIVFAAYLAIWLAETVLWKQGEFLYLASLSMFMLGREVLCLALPAAGLERNFPLFLTPIAAALLITGSALVRRKEWEQYTIPTLVSATGFMLIGLAFQVAYMVMGYEYSVYSYFFTWSVICGVSAALMGESGRVKWPWQVSEILALASLGHLALGTAFTIYVYSHDFPAVAMSLAGMGMTLAVVFAASERRLPGWLRRPLQFGAPVAGAAAIVCSLLEPEWSSYYANVITTTLFALTLALVCFRSLERICDRVAIAAYALATSFSVVFFAEQTGRFMTDAAMAWQCASLAVMAALCFIAADNFADVFDHVAGHVFAALAWLGLGSLLDIYPSNTGYWLAAFGLAAICVSYFYTFKGLDKMAAVGWPFCAVTFIAGIIYPVVLGLEGQAIVNMSLALVVASACVAIYGKERLLYLPLSISVLETVYVLNVIRPPLQATAIGLIVMGPALAYLAAGWMLAEKKRTISDIFLQFCAGMTVLGTVYALAGLIQKGDGDIYLVATMFTAGAIYALVGMIKGYAFMGHISFAHFLLGYVFMLKNGHISSPHLYLLPLGLYLIALGYYGESRGYSRKAVRLLHAVGFTTLALSSLIPSIGEDGGLHAMVLLSESVAAVVLGIWQRRTVFLASGLTFMVVDGVVRFWSPAGSLHWSIYAVLVGTLVIIIGILLETKRELVGKGAAMLQQLKNWK